MYIASIYRICNIDREEYRARIVEAVNTRIRGRGSPDPITVVDIYGTYRSWLNDPWFCSMIAFVDMYMAKHPKHPFSEVRLGTITSRFKDCSALMDLSFLCEILGGDVGTTGSWVWSQKLRDDLVRLNKDHEEADRVDSYTPYMMEIQLSPKSPYSA